MNQEKIGRFIQEHRKNKNLTQEQLAEKLGITKGAVSKWERGLSLMDMSLLKPLSEILEVSIIEIIKDISFVLLVKIILLMNTYKIY
jgi:transcriptional regulator with XRE-family HTH domain